MNRLVGMREVAELLGVKGTDVVRRARRRLKQIAESDPDFQLFALPNQRGWWTTETDLRRLLPQLFRASPDAIGVLEDAIEDVADTQAKLARRITKLENVAYSRTQT